MEAIYGVRPIPDDDGVYPYVYNMAAVAGMRVRENGETYVCTRDIDPLLYPPHRWRHILPRKNKVKESV